MTFQDRCLKEFDSVVRARGEDDFQSRLVELRSLSESAVQFKVESGAPESQAVHTGIVSWSQSEASSVVRMACTCRSFEKGELCQHLWAALVEIDETRQTQLNEGDAKITLIRLSTADIGEWSQTTGAVVASPLKSMRSEVRTANPSAVAGWKSLLESGAFGAEEIASSRRALFLIHLEQSRLSGRLTLELRYQERLKSGEWGVVRPGRFDPSTWDAFEDEADRRILGLLLSPLNASPRGPRSGKSQDQFLEIDPLLTRTVLQELLADGRVYLGSEEQTLQLGQESWQFEIDVKDEPEGYSLHGILRQGREKIAIRETEDLALLSAGYFIRKTSIEPIAWGRSFDLARYLLSRALLIPKKDEVEFVMSTAYREDLPPMRFPASLTWSLNPVEPQAIARFQPNESAPGSYALQADFIYDGLQIGVSDGRKILFDPAKRMRIKRDGKAEKAFIKSLKGPVSLARLANEPVSGAELPALVQDLQENGWQTEVEGKAVVSLSREGALLRKQGEDFVLDAVFDFAGERVSLGAACASAERFLALKDGRLGLLPEAWAKRIELLRRGGSLEKTGGLRLKRASIPLFRCVFDGMANLRMDDEVQSVFTSLGHLIEPGVAEKPRELRAQLRSYQATGLAWLEKVAASGFGGILADDMGLGKTIQIISYLLRRATVPRSGPRPSLVVLPKSLVFNWISEIEKFGPKLRVLDFAGANRGLLKAQDYDVVVTTYHILKNELDRFEKIEFDTIILDEAQAIKNPGSQVAQAVFQLKGEHRIALTGTPIENSLGDLFSLLRFSNPGLIPSGLVATASGGTDALSNDALERLSIALRPFILRRTKKQVLTELPDKTEQPLVCELEGEQKKMYDRLRKHYRDSLKKEIAAKGMSGSKMQVLEALLRLRQAACHPGLVDPEMASKPSAKFEMLLEHLEEIRSTGNKALIFSQFTSFLGLLKPHLEKAGIPFEYLDGQTRDRGAAVERFNSNPDTTAFLISLKAGGTGLNLTTASYVFLMDPWWNPAAEAQAIDRAYRMGQKQKVMAYRLISQGTIEEKIMRLQAQKRSLAEAVISEDQSFLRSLSIDDLADLFE